MKYVSNDHIIVHNHITKIMPLLEKPATKAVPYPYLSVTHSQYYKDVIVVWDNHHMAMRFAYSGKKQYLRFTIDNLLHYQRNDGFTPCCLSANDGPMQYSSSLHAQPFLMQGALMYLCISGDRPWANERFAKLKRYLQYYENNFNAPYGLFRWPVPWMSGIDNDVVTTFFQPDTIISVDINAWMYMEYCAASILARELDNKEACEYFFDKAANLCASVNEILWYEKENSYSAYNLCLDKHQFRYENPTYVKSLGHYAFQTCSNLIPLYARMVDEGKAKRMINRYVLNEEHFLSPFGIRSLSKSSEYYNNAIWGNPPRFGAYQRLTNSNWQGPVWVPITYFMFHALLYYGFAKEAEDLANRVMKVLASSINKINSFTENYHADTGEPLYAAGFASWNILADMMYEEMENENWIMKPIFKKITC